MTCLVIRVTSGDVFYIFKREFLCRFDNVDINKRKNLKNLKYLTLL